MADTISPQRKPVLLVGEDEEAVRKLLKIALEDHGFTLILAANGREAIDSYRKEQERIDLVLLDVQMPELDGPQALVELRKINPAVRCCLMTASSGPYSYEDLHQLGVERIFEKPFSSLNELARSLHELASVAEGPTKT